MIPIKSQVNQVIFTQFHNKESVNFYTSEVTLIQLLLTTLNRRSLSAKPAASCEQWN